MARAAAAHVFLADLTSAEMDDDDRHHLTRVLRLRPGERVSASNGRGGWRPFIYRAGGELVPAGPEVAVTRPSPALTVAFALTKGDRPEWTVQKLTEVGVDRIVPLITDRGVVRWEAGRREHHISRLRAVARQAAMQSRRMFLPEVAQLEELAAVVAGAPGRAALAEPGGAPPSLATPVVLVGPEGGWSEAEAGRGLPTVALSPTILRSESAALAAGVLLSALRASLVGCHVER